MKNVALLLLVCVYLLFTSCGEKLHSQIGYVLNNTTANLIGGNWDKKMTDSIIANDEIYLNTYLQPGMMQSLATGPLDLPSQPDSHKEYVYIFNSDTLDKYKALKRFDGIVKRCLVLKIEIQLNKVKEPFDTVYINSAEPLYTPPGKTKF